jgi:hypothetical protein
MAQRQGTPASAVDQKIRRADEVQTYVPATYLSIAKIDGARSYVGNKGRFLVFRFSFQNQRQVHRSFGLTGSPATLRLGCQGLTELKLLRPSAHDGTFEAIEKGRLDLLLNAYDGTAPTHFAKEVIFRG